MVHPCLIACQESADYRDVIFKLMLAKTEQCINVLGFCAEKL
jgi:hypothetical protein